MVNVLRSLTLQEVVKETLFFSLFVLVGSRGPIVPFESKSSVIEPQWNHGGTNRSGG
jgi:hypothetical protein